MPRICPRCRSDYQDDVEVCWRCRVRLVDHLEPEEDDRVWVDLKPVYFAPDEFSALAVQRVLEEAEISSHVQSAQIPWVDGIMANIKGYWGRVLVAEDELDQAREIVTEYLKSIERAREDDETKDCGDRSGGEETG